jgi:WD40 repeat protein
MNEPIVKRKYQAFISYSHAADGTLAPAVESALERFGKPWYSRSSVEVFRDQLDLALTPDLPREIRKALEQSDSFILFASPGAAQSTWVDKEVQYWIEHRPSAPLLILRTGGELHWGTNDFDWNKTTALPPALRNVYKSEPLWADLGWTKTDADRSLRNPRFLVEIAKLMAGIRGESLTDTLNRAVREHQKVVRSLWAASAVLAMVALAALGAASIASQAKRTADTVAAAIQAQLDETQKRLNEDEARKLLEAEQRSKAAASAQLAARAAAVLPDDLELSTLLALEAMSITPTREAEAALRRTLLEVVPPLVLEGHSDAVNHAQFSSDGRRLLTSSFDGTVRLWDSVSGTNILVLRVIPEAESGDIASGVLSRDGTKVLTLAKPETLAVGHWKSSREPQLHDAATGDLLSTISNRFVVSAALSPDHTQIATAGFDTYAGLWDARSGEIQFELRGHEQRVASVSYSSNGSWVVTACWDGNARVWQASNGSRLAVLRMPEEKGADFASFSPDGSRVLTLCDNDDDDDLRLWDWRNRPGDAVATFTGHDGSIRDVAWSADGTRLVTAGFDQTARVWETATGRCLHLLPAHTDFVNGVAISPNGRWIATVSGDTTGQIWDLATGENLMELLWNHFPRTCVGFSPDGNRIVTGTTDGKTPVYTYEIFGAVEDMLRLARARVHRQLTPEEREEYLGQAQIQ